MRSRRRASTLCRRSAPPSVPRKWKNSCEACATAILIFEDLVDDVHQFDGLEGLHDIVVGAAVQAPGLVARLVLGSDHDDLGALEALVGPGAAADLEAVELGEHEVKHDDVRLEGLGLGEALLPV